MADVETVDASGRSRPAEDIRSAISCIEGEIVKNPMAMSKGGEPLLMHYLVVCDALRELLALRARFVTITEPVESTGG